MKTKQKSALKYGGRETENVLYKKRRDFVLNFSTVVAQETTVNVDLPLAHLA